MAQRSAVLTRGTWRQVWTSIPAANRRWLVINALAVSAVINVAINLTIAWTGTRTVHVVALWAAPPARPSVIFDTLCTTFMLPFFTALTCSLGVFRDLRARRIETLPLDSDVGRLLGGLQRPLLPRALWLGSVTTAVVAPVALVGLVVSGVGDLSVPSFLVFKVAYAVALGAIVTPVVAAAAMVRR